jgi:integrase
VTPLDSGASGRDYDPLKDKAYRDCALGPDIVSWLAWLELGGAAERTLDQYERDLSVLAHLFPNKGLGDLTDLELGTAIRRFPPASRRVRKAAIDSFYKWAIRTRRIEKNPMALLPAVKSRPQKLIDTFTDAEAEALANLPLVDGALVLLLLETGIRKGEARALQARRCDLARERLIVIGGKGGKDRTVPLTRRLTTALAELFTFEGIDQNEYIWYSKPGGGQINRARSIGDGSFHRWWGRCLKDAGVRYRSRTRPGTPSPPAGASADSQSMRSNSY